MRNIAPALALVLTLRVASCFAQEAVSSRRPVANAEQAKQIKALIEQLVFQEGESTNQPVISPGITEESKKEEYRKRFNACMDAYKKLREFKELALPFLIEHLKDKRSSIQFRNHYENNSVGDACYWNIFEQFMDEPSDYSSYGLERLGRDGEKHVKPYWKGSPFDEAGGIEKWLNANKDLSYVQKQIKCLTWLLEKEKAIGASDAESYFENILPLEIRILERRAEAGEDVGKELADKREIQKKKLADRIPTELLPKAKNN